VSIGLETQIEPQRVGFTAHKAGPRMRQLFHESKIRVALPEINPK
jgi:hypothetical protein